MFPFAAVVVRAQASVSSVLSASPGLWPCLRDIGTRGRGGGAPRSNSGLLVSARQESPGWIFLPVHVAPEVWSAGLEILACRPEPVGKRSRANRTTSWQSSDCTMGIDLPRRLWRAEGAYCNLSIGMVRSEQSGPRESELGKGLELSFDAGEMMDGA